MTDPSPGPSGAAGAYQGAVSKIIDARRAEAAYPPGAPNLTIVGLDHSVGSEPYLRQALARAAAAGL